MGGVALTLQYTNIAGWKIHHVDGIYQVYQGNINGDLFVYRRVDSHTLPKTSLKLTFSPLKIGRAPKGNEKVFQPSIFRGENVSFRESMWGIFALIFVGPRLEFPWRKSLPRMFHPKSFFGGKKFFIRVVETKPTPLKCWGLQGMYVQTKVQILSCKIYVCLCVLHVCF